MLLAVASVDIVWLVLALVAGSAFLWRWIPGPPPALPKGGAPDPKGYALLPPPLPEDDPTQTLRALALTHQMTVLRPNRTAHTLTATSAGLQLTLGHAKPPHRSLTITASGCAPALTIARLPAPALSNPLKTGHDAFDAAFALSASPPLGEAVACVGPDARAALLDLLGALPPDAEVTLSYGELQVTAALPAPEMTTTRCGPWVDLVKRAARLLATPPDPTEALFRLTNADIAAPPLRLIALRALLDHPKLPPALRARLEGVALHDMTTPLELRALVAERMGRAGAPIMRACLESSPYLMQRARALQHLCDHLSSDQLRDLVGASWSGWLSLTADPRADGATALAAAAFRALTLSPAPGRLPALAAHLHAHDAKTFDALARAMDAQPDPDAAHEAALLPFLSRAPMPRLLPLLPMLRRRGGSLAVAALRACAARAPDPNTRDDIAAAAQAIQAKLPSDLGGSLSLTDDPNAGALSLSAPAQGRGAGR